MTPEEYIARITEAENALLDEAPKLVLQEAQTGLSIVKQRSTDDGIFKEGKEGNRVPYSQHELPSIWFKGKERNQRGTKYIQEHAKGTWGEFRKAQGLTNEYVNLSYTARMWAAYKIVRQLQSGPYSFQVLIDSSEDESRQKMQWNAKRYGKFFLPTETERKRLAESTKNKLEKIIFKYL